MVELTVAVVPRSEVDVVAVTVTGIPGGVRGTVTGAAAGRTWEVAKLTERTAVFADVQAPLGLPVSYTLTLTNGERAAAGPVTRSAPGRFDLVTDLAGRIAVPMIRPHDDPLKYSPGGKFLDVPGADRMPGLLDPGTPEPTGDITMRVETGPNLAAMHALIRTNRPVVLLHRPCPLPQCDVAPSMLVFLESVKSDLTARKSMAERTFTVGWRQVPLSSRLRAPVATVGDVADPDNFTSVQDVVDRVATVRDLVGGAWLAEERPR